MILLASASLSIQSQPINPPSKIDKTLINPYNMPYCLWKGGVLSMNKQTAGKVGLVLGGSIISIIIGETIGIFLLLCGIALTLTIIGAIIGIPLMLFGLAFMIFAPFGGLTLLTQVKKPCPNCNAILQFSKGQAAITCNICLKRIKIENKGELLTVVS